MPATNVSPRLADLVQIRQRGTRSVNVEHDIYQSHVSDGYVLTALAQQSLLRILERSSGPVRHGRGH